MNPPHWVVLIEGSTLDDVREAGEKFLANVRLAELGARAEATSGLYRLACSIQNLARI